MSVSERDFILCVCPSGRPARRVHRGDGSGGVGRGAGGGFRSFLLVFRNGASWSVGIAAASQPVVGTCGTGTCRMRFVGVRVL